MNLFQAAEVTQLALDSAGDWVKRDELMEDMPSNQSSFPVTRWSLVMRATGHEDGAARRALGELLKGYWRPLYVFARHSGLVAEDAEDAVQSFCEDLIRLESLKAAETARGRLRSFLLASFQNHLRSIHRDANRQKRGGGSEVISLEDAEGALNMQRVDGESPDQAFDRRWAYTLLDRVLERLRGEFEQQGKGSAFALLEPTLVWNGASMSYERLAEKLGVSPGTVAQKVKRLRARYRALLEAEIAETVDGPEAVAEEREHLIRVLSGG